MSFDLPRCDKLKWHLWKHHQSDLPPPPFATWQDLNPSPLVHASATMGIGGKDPNSPKTSRPRRRRRGSHGFQGLLFLSPASLPGKQWVRDLVPDDRVWQGFAVLVPSVATGEKADVKIRRTWRGAGGIIDATSRCRLSSSFQAQPFALYRLGLRRT